MFIVVCSTSGALLVHRRSDGKDLWPGLWDVAVGGVVGAGEDYGAAAQRELAEELGIGDAVPLPIGAGRFADADVDLLARCHRVVHDGPFRFTDGEVVEVRWADAPLSAVLRIAAAPFVPTARRCCRSLILFPLALRHDFPEVADHVAEHGRTHDEWYVGWRRRSAEPARRQPPAADRRHRRDHGDRRQRPGQHALDGPARDRFESEWHGSFKSALAR